MIHNDNANTYLRYKFALIHIQEEIKQAKKIRRYKDDVIKIRVPVQLRCFCFVRVVRRFFVIVFAFFII